MGNRKFARAKNAMRTGKLGHNRLARAIALGILLGGVGTISTPAHAADADWTGATSDDWGDSANWVAPPVNGSFVLIDALAPHDTHLGGAAEVGPMIVGDAGQGRLVIDAGGSLTILGSQPAADPYATELGLVIANAPGSEGTVRVDGAGASLVAEQNTLIGNGGTGTLEVVNGGSAQLGLAVPYTETMVGFGYYAWGDGREGEGHVVVDGADSTLTYAGGLNVLNGTVDIANGGQLVSVVRPYYAWVDMIGFGLPAAPDNTVAELTGQATVTVTGTGSTWDSVNSLNIGVGGYGTLAILDGGTASFEGSAVLGEEAMLFQLDGTPSGVKRAGNGTLLVSGAGSSFSVGPDTWGGLGYLTIGAVGDSTVRIESGATASVANMLTVGDGAQGTLEIDTGGAMTVAGADDNGTGLIIANLAGSSGMVSVNGTGSTLTVDGGAQIGSAGQGSLNITDGGTANLGLTTDWAETLVGFGFYGMSTDAEQGSGEVVVSGTGSTLNYAGGINVLNGVVSILDGGQLVGNARNDVPWWVDDIGVGQVADPDNGAIELDGSGVVVVNGEGSAWISRNQLEVGSGGYGYVAIEDGADASFKSNVEIGVASRGAPGVPTKPGSGNLVVDGAGSTFTVTPVAGSDDSDPGNISIGRKGGYGLVQASNGGTISAEGGIQVGAMGTLTIGGWADDESALAAGIIDTPTLQLDAGGTLALHHDGSATLDTVIAGEGAIDASSGTTRLASDSSAFAGSTWIDGATLAVSGKLGGTMGHVGYSGVGNLVVDQGGSVHVTGGTTWGAEAGSEGTVSVSGAGSTLAVDAGTQIGYAGTGSLSVIDGGHASLGLGEAYAETLLGLGYYGWGDSAGTGNGSILVDGDGSMLEYAGGLNVLNGSMTVSDGGIVAGAVRVADGGTQWVDLIGFGVPADTTPGGSGFAGLSGNASVTVTGKGSAWNSVAGLDIADGGKGSLSILDGGTARFSGNVYVGGQSYLYDVPGGSVVPGLAPQVGEGSLRVSGAGSSLAISASPGYKGWIDVGYRGKGSMEVSNGATASVAYTLYLGDYAQGTLSVTGGGTMSVLGANPLGGGNLLGVNKDGTGTILVSGAGSKLSLAGGLQVGNAGTGAVSVLGGATLNAGLDIANAETLVGAGNYGWAAGAETGKGTITVGGTGSTFNYAGGLNVLNGTVAVSGGGKLVGQKRAVTDTGFWSETIGFGLPANPADDYAGLHGVGAVTVTGAGSSWTSVNALNIGYGDKGSLSVLDGARASFTGYVELGKLSYLYDAPDGGPIPGLAGIAGNGTLLVSGAGSSFALAALAGSTAAVGVLELGSEAAGSVTVNNGATLSAAGGIKVGALGTFTIGGMQGGALAAPGSVTSGIKLMAPAATLVFNHSATAHDETAYAFAPVISGNGQLDVAAGFTRLTGDSSAFTGDTTVDTGATLSVNGSLGGDLSVDGRLQGTGTVGNVTVNDGGTLAPGNSPGTLHVDGDLVMQSGSLYDAEIDGDTGASDSVSVGGNVTIAAGTTLSVTNIGSAPLTPGMNLQLIQTVGDDSAIDGQFDNVTGSSDFLDLGLSYEDGKIVVDVERSDTITFSGAADPAFAGVGAALDGLSDDNALTTLVFSQVTSVDQAREVIADMAGTMHADLRRVILEDSRYPRAALGDRLQDDDASGGVAWARAMGGSASTEGAGVLPGTTVDHRGIMVGYDAAVGDSRLGVAIGSDRGSFATDGKSASADLYDRHLSFYGRSLLGGLRLGYGVAFGSTDAKASRGFDIGSERQQLYSKHEARTTQGFVDLGYRLDGGNTFRYVEPFLNLARVQVSDDATTEEGGVAALEIASGDASATFGTIGLRWNADMGSADFTGSIGWRHAFGFDGASTTQSFVAGGTAFTIDSLPIDNAVMLDLGARFRVSDHARVWLGYNGMMSGSAHDHGLKLQFNLDL